MPITDQQIADMGGLRVSADTAIPPDAVEVRHLTMIDDEVALVAYGTASPVTVLTTPLSPAEAAPLTATVRGIIGAGSDAEVYRRCVAFVHRLLTVEA
jgi:hypothetical protein